MGAHRLATLGRYDLEIDGVAYPPRYGPWFSAVLAPVYFVAPGEIGAAIVPVLGFALAAVWAAFRIGRRLNGLTGGAAAAALLGSNVVFGHASKHVMSDVPATALALWALDRFLAREETGRGSAWVPGILVAAATAFRVESAALFLSFALLCRPSVLGSSRERLPGFRRLAVLALPSVVLVLATAAYQQAVFGDFRRNGYMFWAPLPCDYTSLSFSTGFLRRNLISLRTSGFFVPAAFGVVGGAILLARGSVPGRRALQFAAIAAVPATLLHLVFFFAAPRFHLNLIAFLSVIGGAGVAAGIPGAWMRRARFAPAVIALVPALVPGLHPRTSIRRETAEILARDTPEDAVVVSGIDPVFLEPYLLRGTRRRVVPANRDVEYASKAVAWKRIPLPDPPPKWIGPEGIRWLLDNGALRVCPSTADERPDLLAKWVREGVPVFLDRSFLSAADYPGAPFGAAGLALVPMEGVPWLERFVARE